MKRVRQSFYVHITALSELPASGQQAVAEVRNLIGHDWQIARVDYPRNLEASPLAVMIGWTTDWIDNPHPELLQSVLVKCINGDWKAGGRINYSDSPIYHRKETMLPADHRDRHRFAVLTAQEEAAGLLGRPDLGRASAWARELSQRGLRVEDHVLRAEIR